MIPASTWTAGQDHSVAAQVAEEIRAAGGQAVPCMESVTTMEGGEKIIQTAVDNFGRLDIVVTCAGILRDRMVFNMTEQEWDDVIAVHLKGTFTVVKHACILFRQQRSGRIITFSSESGLVGNSGQANYGAAKSGIAGFTKVVAKDMGRYGVTANAIAPRANTRMIGDIPDSAAEIRARSGVAAIPGEDTLTELDPTHIAPFICYLASDYAQNVNGQTFLVYGDTVSLMSQPRPGTLHLRAVGPLGHGNAGPPGPRRADPGHRQPGSARPAARVGQNGNAGRTHHSS